MSDIRYDDLERLYNEALESGPEPSIAPPVVETTLRGLRLIFEGCLDSRPEIAEFLKETAGLPGEAAVRVTATSVKLIVDDDGNLLAL